MNLHHIFSEIEKLDPEVYERLDTRRDSMKKFANVGKKIAMGALPFALGSMFKTAYGQSSTNADIVEVLNFALLLEYLESTFYDTGLNNSPNLMITSSDKAGITTISNDEKAHVTTLTQTITQLNGTPGKKPEFDFTAGGAFPTVFSDYATFLAVAQAFEDTGVRAYKGQAGNLISNNAVLTAALNIHSVEARHASHIRSARRVMSNMDSITPWIVGKNSNIDDSHVQASYNGEENVSQGGVDITTLDGVSGKVSADAATSAFDEPLSKADVTAIATLFLKG